MKNFKRTIAICDCCGKELFGIKNGVGYCKTCGYVTPIIKGVEIGTPEYFEALEKAEQESSTISQ